MGFFLCIAHLLRISCVSLFLLEPLPMAKKQLRVGMIGYGFMGRAHSNAYRQVGQFFPSQHQVVLKAACARNADQIKAFADQWGYESTETDWRKLVERPDIDVVD